MKKKKTSKNDSVNKLYEYVKIRTNNVYVVVFPSEKIFEKKEIYPMYI
jgi:hypothetical protein